MIVTFSVSPYERCQGSGDARKVTDALTTNGHRSATVGAPGVRPGAGEVAAITDELMGAAPRADWVVLCGALPSSAPSDLFALVIRRLRDTGTKVALNSDWSGLCTVLGRQPELLVLAAGELEQAAGFPVREPWEAFGAIERLRGFGPAAVLASLGSDGAVLLDDTGTYHAQAPDVGPDTRDALLAGFLAGGGRGPSALVEAVAWAAADGTTRPVESHRSAVELTWVDALELVR